MDPITIICSLAGALKLIKEVWEGAQWMQKVYGTYAGADKCLQSMALECHIYGESIKAIGQWLKRNQTATSLKRQMRTTHHAITLVRNSMANVLLDMKKYQHNPTQKSSKDTRLSRQQQNVKLFSHFLMDKAKQQWFADTMRGHLIEMRAHAATLHLCLGVIDLTGNSPAHNKQVPDILDAKTGNLEKRLMLRHLITKALTIKRAGIGELPKPGDLEEASGTLATSIPTSAQKLTFYDVVQLARQQALAQKTQRSNQDLIDVSDIPEPSVNPSSFPNSQNDLTLLDFHNPTFSQQSFSSPSLTNDGMIHELDCVIASTDDQPMIAGLDADPPLNPINVETVRPIELATSCPDRLDEANSTISIALEELPLQPNTLADYPSDVILTQATGQPGIEPVRTVSLHPCSSKTANAIQDQASAAGKDVLETPQSSSLAVANQIESHDDGTDNKSLASSTTPSIFSHSSSLTAGTGSSLPGISEEDMQKRNSKSDLEPKKRRPYDNVASGLPNIDEPDEEGFPWIVQAARNGQEEMIRKLLISGADIQVTHISTHRNALAEAALHGHQNCIDLLVEEGCLMEFPDAEGNTALHHACANGHLAAAKSLVARGASINAPGLDGQSPLHLAIRAPYQNVVMLLVQSKANVNARDMRSWTPLHIAASQGNVAMCSYLLHEGAQLDSREAQSKTSLQLACEAGNYELVQMMMNHSKLNATNMTFLAAFSTAVEFGHVRIAELFFSEGLKLQELKRDRYKPITLAATSGCLAMVELMIQEGCEIQSKDDSGWNALHFASHHGHYQVIDRLLSCGVPATARTSRKESPLLLAVKGGHFPVAERLLRSEKGSSLPSLEDERGQQPVHHTVRTGSLEIFELLMSNGGKIDVENVFGWQPLHIATAYGHIHLVERLLQQGAAIEEKLGSTSIKKDQTHKIVEEGYWAEARWPYPGSRVLHLACEYGREQIAQLLISKGAKMDVSCGEGWQPLHHATYFGSSALVKTLLQGGVNPHVPTNEGKTPSTLGFCTIGTPIPAEDKEHIQRALREAMDRMKKPKNFKVAIKKPSTLQDKHNALNAATFSMNVTSRPQLQKAKTTAQVSNFAARPGPVSSSSRPRLQYHAHTAPLPSKMFPTNPAADIHLPSNDPAVQADEVSDTPLVKIKSLPGTDDAPPSDSSASPPTSENANASQSLPAPSTETTLTAQPDPKLQRRSTFGLAIVKPGLDISKLSLGGMTKPTFDIGKQTLELGNKTLELGKHGFEISKQGLEKSNKQGIDMGKRGMDFGKERYNRALKFATMQGRSGGEKKKKKKMKVNAGREGGKGEVGKDAEEGDGDRAGGAEDEGNGSDDAGSVFSLGEYAELGDRSEL
ncbi:MAG: hypothetical protein Q9205_005957 [Flavoplaca limonia]